jgi:hypothetical protein
MMKTLKSTTIILLGSLLMGRGCSKDDLTPKTHKGANTLSCRVNGKVFTAKYMGLFGGVEGVKAHYLDNTIFISAGGPGIFDKYDIIYFSLENPSIGKVYTISDENILEGKPVSCSYVMDDNYDGYGPAYFKITYFDSQIVAGEFSFKAIADKYSNPQNIGKIISIMDGRFDIQITSK